MQDKYLLFGVRQLGFQQDNVFQHPASDLGQNAFLNSGALRQRQGAECLIQQQAADQRIGLRIAETGLGDHRAAGFPADIRQVQHVDLPRQVQQIQIFFDLRRMNIVQRQSLLRLVPDLQQLPQAVCDSYKVNAIKDVRRVLPIPAKIAGGNAKVVGFPILCQHFQRETVVDVLHHAVDGAGQFVPLIQVTQMAEMSLVLIAAQGVLDVACNSRIHILVRAFLAGKRGGFVVVDTAETHSAAVADILVDAMNAEHRLKLAVRDEGRVQQNAAVVELLILREQETQ